jgi:hypothetical protein
MWSETEAQLQLRCASSAAARRAAARTARQKNGPLREGSRPVSVRALAAGGGVGRRALSPCDWRSGERPWPSCGLSCASAAAARPARLRARHPEPGAPVVCRPSSACMAPGASREGRRAVRSLSSVAVGWCDPPPRHTAVPRSATARRAAARRRALLLVRNHSTRPSALVRRGCSRRRASAPGEPTPSNVRHVVDQVGGLRPTRAAARPARLQSQGMCRRLLGRPAHALPSSAPKVCGRRRTLAAQRRGLALRMDAASSTVAGLGPLRRGGA